ncbi:DUF2796 domain-containing protein [Candidatus Accumulibacter sp. ACC012]|uniref:ZrgA family zinc uptake protein n=1 Tax=Candidatus Accumulibacter sp. ACC012 TaxID=2823332 RepID=UPI0025BA5F08|nr:DUF2796 domain-containing protein [Candidatus Accumulibacter sp. ACC012]
MNAQVLLAATLICGMPFAHAQHKHVHGEGRLDAVIDEGSISLDVELPLDAVVGFERAPKNDKQKAALAGAEKILNDAATLWQPTPAAGCSVQSVQVGMPKFDGEHADIDANYVFRCTDFAALKGSAHETEKIVR